MTQHERRWVAVSLVLFVLALGFYLAFAPTGYAVESTHTVVPFQSKPIAANYSAPEKVMSYVTTNPVVPGSSSVTPGATTWTFEGSPDYSGVPYWVLDTTFSGDWHDGPGWIRSNDASTMAVIYWVQLVRKANIESPQPYGLLADTAALGWGSATPWAMNPASGSTYAFHRNVPTSAYYFRRGGYQIFGTEVNEDPPCDPAERMRFDNIVIYTAKYERQADGTGWDGEYRLASDWRSVGTHSYETSGGLASVSSTELAPAVALSGMAQINPYYIAIGEVNPADNVIGGTFSSVGQVEIPFQHQISMYMVGGSFNSTEYADQVFHSLDVSASVPPSDTGRGISPTPREDLTGLGLGDVATQADGYASDAGSFWSWLSPWEWFLGEDYFQ